MSSSDLSVPSMNSSAATIPTPMSRPRTIPMAFSLTPIGTEGAIGNQCGIEDAELLADPALLHGLGDLGFLVLGEQAAIEGLHGLVVARQLDLLRLADRHGLEPRSDRRRSPAVARCWSLCSAAMRSLIASTSARASRMRRSRCSSTGVCAGAWHGGDRRGGRPLRLQHLHLRLELRDAPAQAPNVGMFGRQAFFHRPAAACAPGPAPPRETPPVPATPPDGDDAPAPGVRAAPAGSGASRSASSRSLVPSRSRSRFVESTSVCSWTRADCRPCTFEGACDGSSPACASRYVFELLLLLDQPLLRFVEPHLQEHAGRLRQGSTVLDVLWMKSVAIRSVTTWAVTGSGDM